ncbi:MAG: PadR family transcriptional regulator [Candidatus Bathyarchaeia archaeon]
MKENKAIDVMKEQLKRGYLKLAILYTLLKGPMHGYEMLKAIREDTLGLISPKAGSLYPALRDLEKNEFISGEWCGEGRRIKVYKITDKGKEIFREVVERHFTLASAIRKWLFSQLAPLHPIEDLNTSSEILHRAMKILLSDDAISQNERIEFLKDLREYLKRVSELISDLITNINKRLMEMEKSRTKLSV